MTQMARQMLANSLCLSVFADAHQVSRVKKNEGAVFACLISSKNTSYELRSLSRWQMWTNIRLIESAVLITKLKKPTSVLVEKVCFKRSHWLKPTDLPGRTHRHQSRFYDTCNHDVYLIN